MPRNVHVLTAIMLIIAVSLLCSCGGAPREPGRYYADKHDFSIKFPQGWQVAVEEDGAVISAVSPLGEGDDLLFESVNVIVENVIFEVDLNEYYNALNRTAQTELAYFDQEMEEQVTISNVPAWKTVFTYVEEGAVIKTLGYCFVKGGKIYMITCVSDEYSYPSYAAEFESAAESFRFE